MKVKLYWTFTQVMCPINAGGGVCEMIFKEEAGKGQLHVCTQMLYSEFSNELEKKILQNILVMKWNTRL